ncbi:MAG TPA: glycosyltransferase family 2 protein [Terracidiphilus sp.]|nr:glycosyltransferase family 2 protein [Terracidiphilus sp.]
MAFDLTIVLPTFNESRNVRPIVDRLEKALEGIRYEVIFVDDDSPDGTADAVRRVAQDRDNLRVLQRIGRRGLASACIEGILGAAAPFVAVMDADMQHDEAILPEMLRRIREENLDLVVGSRNMAGGSMGEFAKSRVKLSQLGRKLSLMGAEHELSDPMSGFFMVRLASFEQFAHRLSGIGFKILLDIVLSAGPGLRIGEVPYRFRQREHGESKLDLLVGLEYFELLVDKHLGGIVNVRFVLFGMVGALGVGVHLLILNALLKFAGVTFATGQAVTTFIVMILNFVLNNSVTYRDRRLKGWRFWKGLVTFCLACGLGVAANVAIANEAFRRGVPWVLAAITGLLFTAVWNYGVTSMTTWRQERRSGERRAQERMKAGAARAGRDADEMPAKTL